MKLIITAALLLYGALSSAQPRADKVEGMLIGSVLGDAAGAPYEFFYPAQRSYWSSTQKQITREGLNELARRFHLAPNFRKGSSFGQWKDYAPGGSVTDDTRLKIIFMNTLRHHPEPTADALAQEILAFEQRLPEENARCKSWLSEFGQAARWQLGEEKDALPADRLWGGTPGIAGQMALIPMAAMPSASYERGYKRAWQMNFLDNGTARDINAAVVVGLTAALKSNATWASIETAMRNTDPYQYGHSQYGQRPLNHWLDLAHRLVADAEGNVARLFQGMESKLEAKVWWEAWVPLVVVFSCAEMADYQPLAAMQLSIEFGHDTDSYAQLMGAFMGAIHGKDAFPETMREQVCHLLKEQYGEDLYQWSTLLSKTYQ